MASWKPKRWLDAIAVRAKISSQLLFDLETDFFAGLGGIDEAIWGLNFGWFNRNWLKFKTCMAIFSLMAILTVEIASNIYRSTNKIWIYSLDTEKCRINKNEKRNGIIYEWENG